jgi:hypothetical protein
MRKIKVVVKKLGREQALGQAYFDTGVIEVDPRQDNREMLDTIIHETLHLLNTRWKELKIRRQTRSIARALWKSGYRRIYE